MAFIPDTTDSDITAPTLTVPPVDDDETLGDDVTEEKAADEERILKR